MKPQFSNRRQTSVPLFGSLLVVILISIGLFGFDRLTGGLVRSYARTTGSLIWTAATGVISQADKSGVLRSRRSLVAENDSLKAEIAMRDENAARFQSLQDENTALAEMAHLAETNGAGVTTRVLSSFRASPYGTFLIGGGTAEGIQKGNVVLTSGGFVLGTVSDADAHTATVQELFAPTKTIDLIVKDVAFSATGRGGGNASADVPRDAAIAKGDAATVAAFGGRPVGIVGDIRAASSSATQTLFIRIPVNLETLAFVYVIPRNK